MQIDLSKSAGTDVIAHELFHEIDETYGLTDNGMLKDSIQADYQKLQEDAKMYGITIHEMLYLQYPEVFKKMVAADGIILGSPVYSANVSSSMQAFLERAAVVADMNPGLLQYKAGASVASARRGGAMTALDAMNHFFLNHEMFVVGSSYWNMSYGRLPGDVMQDQEGMETMRGLGRNMAFLLKKLHACS